ncbi:hypothetical protein EZS27_027186 [termite gut metagenome]|uniref:Uncharacterized protein n=1 Tax=termite gut metagenome TaxID=433724 RepID=A0A5J4QPB1_9ZZZZ
MENQNQASTVDKETGNPQQIISKELVDITLELKRISDYFIAYGKKTDESEEWIHSVLFDIKNDLSDSSIKCNFII